MTRVGASQVTLRRQSISIRSSALSLEAGGLGIHVTPDGRIELG